MIETLHAAEGVGLAAQEGGRKDAEFVVDVPASCMKDPEVRAFNAPIRMPLVAFNPVIVSTEGSQRDSEGCLSFPGMSGHVTRPFEITLSCLDIDGNPQMVKAYQDFAAENAADVPPMKAPDGDDGGEFDGI